MTDPTPTASVPFSAVGQTWSARHHLAAQRLAPVIEALKTQITEDQAREKVQALEPFYNASVLTTLADLMGKVEPTAADRRAFAQRRPWEALAACVEDQDLLLRSRAIARAHALDAERTVTQALRGLPGAPALPPQTSRPGPSPPGVSVPSRAHAALHRAASDRDPVAMAAAVAAGADPNATFGEHRPLGRVLLTQALARPPMPGSSAAVAADERTAACVRQATALGYQWSAPRHRWNEPCMIEALLGLGDAPQTLQALLDAGVDPNAPRLDHGSDGVVHQALWSRASSSLAVLLAAGASPDGPEGAATPLEVLVEDSVKTATQWPFLHETLERLIAAARTRTGPEIQACLCCGPWKPGT